MAAVVAAEREVAVAEVAAGLARAEERPVEERAAGPPLLRERVEEARLSLVQGAEPTALP